MNEAVLKVFHERAEQLSEAMQFLREEPAYSAASVLLAVHSAIAYSDAIHIKLKAKRPKSEDHRKAALSLEAACNKERMGIEGLKGLKHFKILIGRKTDIACGERTIHPDEIQALCITADRFREWSEKILRKKTN